MFTKSISHHVTHLVSLPKAWTPIRKITLTTVALVAIAHLPGPQGGPCEEMQNQCNLACGGKNGQSDSSLLGCKIAYLACKIFTGR